MSVEIITTDHFRQATKKLLKKYPSLKVELLELYKKLLLEPKAGTALGNDCYKIRIAIKSKNKGKSGGARIITHYLIFSNQSKLFLLTIYDKSEYGSISEDNLKNMLAEIKS